MDKVYKNFIDKLGKKWYGKNRSSCSKNYGRDRVLWQVSDKIFVNHVCQKSVR